MENLTSMLEHERDLRVGRASVGDATRLLPVVRRGAKRRRAVNIAARGVAALAVVAVAGVGAYALANALHVPDPNSTPMVTDGVVSFDDPALPPAPPVTEAVLSGVDSGWTVAVYRAMTPSGDGSTDRVSAALYLTSPDGRYFAAGEFPAPYVLLEYWRADRGEVVFSQYSDDGRSTNLLSVMDLKSGAITELANGPSFFRYAGTLDSGAEVWLNWTIDGAQMLGIYYMVPGQPLGVPVVPAASLPDGAPWHFDGTQFVVVSVLGIGAADGGQESRYWWTVGLDGTVTVHPVLLPPNRAWCRHTDVSLAHPTWWECSDTAAGRSAGISDVWDIPLNGGPPVPLGDPTDVIPAIDDISANAFPSVPVPGGTDMPGRVGVVQWLDRDAPSTPRP